ncbi:hypothetical protein RvY_13537 [Ramazzottius varieornatus]|uniref:Uncharacterized protein n=1 Tax=Ramazzottius varieornatus TaxID=947166 RepID=A0A1D1VN89_RAMVA|nr:hypothetical protein RvY_13537 [Ramazzottius varieornatus]
MESAPSVREDLLEGCRHGIRRRNILQRNVTGIPPYPRTGMLCFTAIALGYLQYLGKKYRSAPADSADMAEKGWNANRRRNSRS